MKLSKNFSLAEMTKTSVRTDNYPDAGALDALFALCKEVMQPLRDALGKPLYVSSGYRSPKVNAVIGGSSRSQHCKGEACDFECPGISNYDLAKAIIDNKIPFDQLILEFYKPGVPDSGWVHVSYKANGSNRYEILTAARENGKTVYKKGLVP
jgi:hypothetical protein